MDLKGKILFVFSDPGGAKPCLALMAEHDGGKVRAVSDRLYPFYDDFDVSVQHFDGNPESIIKVFQPDLVFTGTSYTSDIEHRFISESKRWGIPCWSFIDHWTNVSKRFIQAGGKLLLPDCVLVVDEKARHMAIDEGISSDRILVCGNPYHTWLRKWKPRRRRREFLKEINIEDEQRRLILFAPDPLSNVNGREIYGFDEVSALEALETLLNQADKKADWLFLIKPHPNQDVTLIEDIIARCNYLHLLPPDINTNEAVYFSDLVVGFFSSILLEANILGKLVIRFMITKSKNDPFERVEVGILADERNLVFEIMKSIG